MTGVVSCPPYFSYIFLQDAAARLPAGGSFRVTRTAIAALLHISESYLVNLFEDTMATANLCGCVTVTPKHMMLVRYLRRETVCYFYFFFLSFLFSNIIPSRVSLALLKLNAGPGYVRVELFVTQWIWLCFRNITRCIGLYFGNITRCIGLCFSGH